MTKMLHSRPKLSVAMITYNHDQFIAQALESVLMQKTNFEYEIVIGDDASTDSTPAKIASFVDKYPNKVYPIFQKVNLGPGGNLLSVLDRCQGEYIALLEGDDYWTDESKLQIQVEFLDAKSDYSLCFHKYSVYSEYTKNVVRTDCHMVPGAITNEGYGYTTRDILAEIASPRMCTVVYRASMIILPRWIGTLDGVDWALNILLANSGFMGYIDRNLAAYRLHQGGIYSSADNYRRRLISLKAAERIDEHFQNQFHGPDRDDYRRALHMKETYLEIARLSHRRCNFHEAKHYFRKAFNYPYNGNVAWHQVVTTFLEIYASPLYSMMRLMKHLLMRLKK